MIPKNVTRAMRRLRGRNAARRQRRIAALRNEVHSRALSRGSVRSSTYPRRLIDESVRDDGTRRPTRQELQWREKLYYAERELGIA